MSDRTTQSAPAVTDAPGTTETVFGRKPTTQLEALSTTITKLQRLYRKTDRAEKLARTRHEAAEDMADVSRALAGLAKDVIETNEGLAFLLIDLGGASAVPDIEAEEAAARELEPGGGYFAAPHEYTGATAGQEGQL